mmetsp:Transcript_27784/g.70169  ORF Transcript_27784/g.70169 Transcript_27784/m.70169 type:complete len:692 (+) Transcript_27784:253-2328(+)|eukprot:g10680.t1
MAPLPPAPFYRSAGFGILSALAVAVLLGWLLNPGGSVTSVLTLFFLQFSCVGGFYALTESSSDGLGGEWIKGLGIVPDVFATVGGMIAGLPLVVPLIENCFHWFYFIGSTPAHAACSFLDATMQAATVAEKAVGDDVSVSYPASALAYFLGDFLAFSLPLGLLIVRDPESLRYLLLGLVPGLFCIPVGCAVTYALLACTGDSEGVVYVNSKIEPNPVLDYALRVDILGSTLRVVPPCWILGCLMALAIWAQPPGKEGPEDTSLDPAAMNQRPGPGAGGIKIENASAPVDRGSLTDSGASTSEIAERAAGPGDDDPTGEDHDETGNGESLLVVRVFVGYGTLLNFFLRACFLVSALEYVGGLSFLFKLLGAPPFLQLQPLLRNDGNAKYFTYTNSTGLDVAASMGILFSGIMPFMHVLRAHYLEQICRLGRRIGFTDPEGHGVRGMLGTLSSMIVLFRLMPKIAPRECVLAVAFSISASYILGCDLAFSSVYQPPMCVPVLTGKLVGGLCGMALAKITTCKLVEDEHALHSEETVRRRTTRSARMSGLVPGVGAGARLASGLGARLSSRIGETPYNFLGVDEEKSEGDGGATALSGTPRKNTSTRRVKRSVCSVPRINDLELHMNIFFESHAHDDLEQRVSKIMKRQLHQEEEKMVDGDVDVPRTRKSTAHESRTTGLGEPLLIQDNKLEQV